MENGFGPSYSCWKVDIPAGVVSASLIGIGVAQPCLASQVDYRPLPLKGLAYFNSVLGNIPH